KAERSLIEFRVTPSFGVLAATSSPGEYHGQNCCQTAAEKRQIAITRQFLAGQTSFALESGCPRQGAASAYSAIQPRGLEPAFRPPRSDQNPHRVQRAPRAAPGADPVWTDAAITVRVLSRRGGDHGRRSDAYAGHGLASAGLRRLPLNEFRYLRHAGAAL